MSALLLCYAGPFCSLLIRFVAEWDVDICALLWLAQLFLLQKLRQHELQVWMIYLDSN